MTRVILQKEGTYTAVGIIGDTKQEVEERYSKKPTKRKNVFEIALLDQIYGPGVGKTMVG